ncbi:MAG: MFS transporter [Actinobacteria bacterium]|nr:MFS transporter [Actinomycetota bacterium]
MASVNKTKFSSSFEKLWSASAASNVSDGLLKTAVPLLATTLTQDPFLISSIAALVMLPWLLFAIPVGGLVDRFNRRHMLALANSIRLTASLFLASAVGFGFINFPLLLLTTFVFGIGEVIYDTTLQSMIPQVLENDQMERGNARIQVTSVTLGEFVGAPLSGLLYAVSIALPFFFGAAGVLIAVLIVLTLPLQYENNPVPPKPKGETGFWEDIRFGIRYLYDDKVLLKLVLLTSSIGFFFSASSSTIVLFLTKTLEVPTALFGVVIAAPAVGAIIGSVLSHRFSARFGRTKVMAASMLVSSFLVVIQGFSPNYWVLAALFALGNAIITMWNVLLMASYHQMIPTELFGRIHGTRRTLVWGLMPLGALLGGAIAAIDLRMPFFLGGGICLLISIIGFRFIVNLRERIAKSQTSD